MSDFYHNNEYWIMIIVCMIDVAIWLWCTGVMRRSKLISRRERWIIMIMVALPIVCPVASHTLIYYITRSLSIAGKIYFCLNVIRRMRRREGQR